MTVYHFEQLVLNFQSLILDVCRKHQYAHLFLSKNLQKSFTIPIIKILYGCDKAQLL